MTNSEWLAGLKVGDRVVVSASASRGQWIRRVERATKLHVVVGGKKYRRSSGRSIGGDSWHWLDIKPVTPEIEKAIRVGNARYALSQNIQQLSDNAAIEVDALVRKLLAGAKPQC